MSSVPFPETYSETKTTPLNPLSTITKIEEKKIQTFFDYLFYDQTRYYASFARFYECFFPLMPTNFNEALLFEIFKEISGKNKKYITIPRFIQKYSSFKTNKADISITLKHFFTFIFSNLIKDNNFDNLQIGCDNPSTKKFSSTNFINSNRLSNVSILANDNIYIRGLILKYDDVYTAHLFNENKKYAYYGDVVLNYMNELKAFDTITHLYGRWNGDRINYLGFKCRSGKTLEIGDCLLGEPFLFGVYGQKLHCLRVQIDDVKGLTAIEPIFKETSISNIAIDISQSLFKSELVLFEERNDLFFEEKFFNEDKPMNDDMIKFNMVKDYNKPLTQDILNEINIKDEYEGIKEYLKDNELIKKEAKEYYNMYCNEDNNGSVLDKDTTSRYLKTKAPKWNGVTVKRHSPQDIIALKSNYDVLISKIKNEIDREIQKEKLKFKYDKNFDFYDEYLMKYDLLSPYPLSPKRFNSYADIKEMKYKFEAITNDREYNKIDNDNINNELYVRKDPDFNYDAQRIWYDWQALSKKINVKAIIKLILLSFSVNKALKIMDNVEDNYYDDETPLETKLKIYEILINNEPIVSYLLNTPNYNYEYNIDNTSEHLNPNGSILQVNEGFNEDEREKNEGDDHLNEINRKINKIEKMINHNKNHKIKPQLKTLYNALKNQQQKILNDLSTEHDERFKDYLSQAMDVNEIENEILSSTKESKLNLKDTLIFMPTGEIPTTNLSEVPGIENIPVFKKQKIFTGLDYRDQIFFPPNDHSLGFIQTSPQINWGKADLILYTNNYCILPKENNFEKYNNNIVSGLYYDYYFLSAIYMLLQYPNIIYSLFPVYDKSGDGLYGVKLRINGRWKLVLLDDYFPLMKNQRGINYFAFASLGNNIKEIWLNLIEKAYAKVKGSYEKIQDGNIKDVFDLLTNAPVEKIELCSLERNALFNIVNEAFNNKFILCGKANNNTCYDNGIMKRQHYQILQMKIFNVGVVRKYMLVIKNIFGELKYNYNWSERIPSLKNNKITDENTFYISLDDFLKYFSVLYILHIHPIENEFNYSYQVIKYSKNEVYQPNIISLNVNDKSKVYIQFHQKNPKFVTSNTSNKKLVPSFLLLCNEDYSYIKSISSSEVNFYMEIELDKGKYILYTDIIHRYITKLEKDLYCGYSISVYSEHPIELTRIRIDPNQIIKTAIIDYCNKNLQCKKEDIDIDMYYYHQGSKNTFPFSFFCFNNKGTKQNILKLRISNTNDNVKNYSFYIEHEDFNDKQTQSHINKEEFILNDNFSPGQSEIAMIIKLNEMCNFKCEYCIEDILSDKELQEYIVNNGQTDYLDEEGKLVQYFNEYRGGYVIVLENKYESELFRMKLVLKGLELQNNPIKGDHYFYLNPLESKMFKLKPSSLKSIRQISFQFQFIYD